MLVPPSPVPLVPPVEPVLPVLPVVPRPPLLDGLGDGEVVVDPGVLVEPPAVVAPGVLAAPLVEPPSVSVRSRPPMPPLVVFALVWPIGDVMSPEPSCATTTWSGGPATVQPGGTAGAAASDSATMNRLVMTFPSSINVCPPRAGESASDLDRRSTAVTEGRACGTIADG